MVLRRMGCVRPQIGCSLPLFRKSDGLAMSTRYVFDLNGIGSSLLAIPLFFAVEFLNQ